MTFSESIPSLFTLAHEIGHAIQFHVRATIENYLDYQPSRLHSEIAAVFFELLVGFEYLENFNKNMQSKKAFLEHVCSNIFKQTMTTLFEIDLYRMAQTSGELDLKQVREGWVKQWEKFYGDSIKLCEAENNMFFSIPHLFFEPLISAMYPIAQIVAMNLYLKYREQPENFKERFFKFLCLASNANIFEFLSVEFDIDIDDRAVWQRGIDSTPHI